jgi:hypothetical protein
MARKGKIMTMTTHRNSVLLSLWMVAGAACGYKFVKPPVLPKLEDIKNLATREYVPLTGGAYLDNWDQLIGNYFYIVPKTGTDCSDGNTKIWSKRTTRKVADGCTPIMTKIPKVFVSGAFQGSTALDVSAVFVTLTADPQVAYDGVIEDLGNVFAPNNKCMPDSFDDTLKPANACSAIWVEGVTLTAFIGKEYTSLKGSTNVVGTAFSVGDSVYTSNSETHTDYELSIDYRIAKNYSSNMIPSEPLGPGDKGPKVKSEYLHTIVKGMKSARETLAPPQ